MGYSIGLIAIKGNHSDKIDKLFNAFDYAEGGDTKQYSTWAEAVKFLNDNYFEYANREISLRGLWIDNGWTIIHDPEMVDPLEQKKIEALSKSLNADIWTFLIQTTSGSFSFSKFSPDRVRHFFAGAGQVAENEGMPLPEEQGLNINEKIFTNDLESLTRKLGFKIQPDTHGEYIVKYLAFNEQMKAQMLPFKQEVKPQQPAPKAPPTNEKPWWKIW